MRDAQIEEGAGITLDFDATFVQFFGALNVTLLQLLSPLFEALHGFHLCRI
jgi:hypothetical protein